MVSSRAEREPHRRLRGDPITLMGRFGTASNATFLAWLGEDPPEGPADLDDLDPDRLAVYKPRRGERPLWDFPRGTLHRREVAAFEISELLGWELVPATVLRDDGPHGEGSVQRFVPHDPDEHYFWLLDHGGPEIVAQLEAMVVFDLVIDNADRKAGHVLLEGDRIRLVDHGVSLHVEPKLRTVAWDFATAAVPAHLREDVGRVAELVEDGPPDELADLLADEELAALARRARRVATLETFPEPSGPRPYPWPLL